MEERPPVGVRLASIAVYALVANVAYRVFSGWYESQQGRLVEKNFCPAVTSVVSPRAIITCNGDLARMVDDE